MDEDNMNSKLESKPESVTFNGADKKGEIIEAVGGMKVLMTDEKELIIEPFLKWAGYPNIIAAAKAFGLRAIIQVVDLQVFASPRITLKPLVPSFPCFANIYVSLMENPHVDFGLKVIGADVMSIPGLYRFVQLRNTSYKEFEKVLAIILGIMSAAIILAEATLLPSVDLSLISILIDSYLGMTMPLRYMKL
ncbi:hypothetical protein ACFE04_011189 [Oxalis oulophora]